MEELSIREKEARSHWQNSMEFVERCGLDHADITVSEHSIAVRVDEFSAEFPKNVPEAGGIASYENESPGEVVRCNGVSVEACDSLLDAMEERNC